MGSSVWWILALYFFPLDFSGCCFLFFCEIIYLGMTGEVDVSEQDNSVSEHEVLVSLSIIKSLCRSSLQR